MKPRIKLVFVQGDPIHPWHAYLGDVLRAMSPSSAWAIEHCWLHWRQELRDRERAKRARDQSREVPG